MLILFEIILCCTIPWIYSLDFAEPIWTSLSDSLVEQWYSESDRCILKNWDNPDLCNPNTHIKDVCSAVRRCVGVRSAPHRLVSQGRPRPESVFRMPLGYGGDKPSETLLMDILVRISKSGHRLVHLGDSLMQGQIIAFFCKLMQENDKIIISPRDYTGVSKDRISHFTVRIPLVTTEVMVASWAVAHIYFIPDVNPPHASTIANYNNSLRMIASSTPTLKTILILNVGLHSAAGVIQSSLRDLLEWTEQVVLSKKGNVAIFRELTAQNFPFLPSGRYTIKSKKAYMELYMKKNNVSFHHVGTLLAKHFNCVETPYDRRSQDAMWLAQKPELAKYGYVPYTPTSLANQTKFLVLFTDITRPLYDVHIPAVLDCTHYCGPLPLVWQVVWYQLHHILMSNSNLDVQKQRDQYRMNNISSM